MSRRRRLTGVFARATTFEALRAAAVRAARGLRRRRDVARWLADLERHVLALQGALHDGSWRPGPLRTFRIRDPKPRTIAVAPFADRVVHHALCHELQPMFERFADPDSYACREGRGTWAAVRRVQALSRRHPWCLRLDVRHFFESVRHAVLMDRLAARVADERALDVVRLLLSGGVGPPGVGLPIGNLTSQHFGNFLLGHLDHHARQHLRVAGWVRYMDDIVVFGPSKDAMWAAHDGARAWLGEALGLALKDEATRVLPVHAGVPFLGLRVWPQAVRLDAARRRRLARRLRGLGGAVAAGEAMAEVAAPRAQAAVAWAAQSDTLAWRRAWVASHAALDT
jgi:RNA-directed DNA polymerase